MTVILKDQLTGVLNHPIFDAVDNAFNVRFTSIADAIKGVPLNDIHQYSFDEYFARNLFKKIEDDLGLDPDRAATESALDHVTKTVENSKKFSAVLAKEPANLMKILVKAQTILHEMFKEFSIFDVVPRFTLGATEDLARGTDVLTRIKTGSGYATLKSKFNSVEFGWLMAHLPHVESDDIKDYTLFECVPKTAKESRPIGYHEAYVLAVQAGIGDYIQRCLLHYGIDITTAQDKHVAYAMFYSVYGDYCTMDQSNASQNILRLHCKFLLPSGLYEVIDKVCPSTIIIDGKSYHHEMMAAQGNGLIFPLQTAIFYALISACCWAKGIKSEVLQYGDDSIFKTEAFDVVHQVFTAIGFEVNAEKSFHTGHIRESCGGDFLNGTNVRPYYVKRLPETTTDWYHVCNGIYRVGYSNNDHSWRSTAFKHFWLRCLSNIPANERLYGPVSYGDVVLHSSCEYKYKLNQRGTKIRTLGSVYSEDGENFGRLSQGLPGNVLFKAVTLPFLKGSGYVLYSESYRVKHKISDLGYYPKNLGIRRVKSQQRWESFPLSIVQNHDNVDHIFDRLKLDSTVMMNNYKRKEQYYRNVLIELLQKVRRERKLTESRVQDIVL